MDMRVPPTEPMEAAATLAAGKARPYPWRLGIAISLILGLTATAWWFWRGPSITAVRATRGAAAEIVYATGSVKPETWSRSTPLVRGRIVERCRCEGKAVKSGDLLARLDDKEASATLNDLRALEDFQHRKFDRQAQLLARGASTFFRIDPSEVVMDPDPADDARRQRAPLIPSRVKYDRAFF